MVCLKSITQINGIHRIKISSISDPGGYTVIGITNNQNELSYSNYCIGLAGNKYSSTMDIGKWSNQLKWGINDIVEFYIDSINNT